MTHPRGEDGDRCLSYIDNKVSNRVNSSKKVLFIIKGIGLKLKRKILTFNPKPYDRIS